MRPRGHSLIELITVVLIVAVLTCIAVPRLRMTAVRGVRAEAVARKIAADLRLARARAILEPTQRATGCALVMTGSEPYSGYQLVRAGDAGVTAIHALPREVRCTGGRRFEFDSLGALTDGSDAELRVSAEDRTLTITVQRATGMVKCL